jgi:uncharacterized protein
VKKLLPSDKIYISQSGISGAGRGVFARRDIKKGEVIEECPIIEVSEDDPSNPSEGILITYLYYFGENKEKSLVALGFGSLYNHTYNPNSFYRIDDKEQTITFIALIDIKKDEEITVNYNHENPADTSPLWFEEKI